MSAKKPQRTIPTWLNFERYDWVEGLLESDPILLYQEFMYRAEALGDATVRAAILSIIERDDGRLTSKPLEVFVLQPAIPNGQQEADLDLLEANPHPFIPGTPAIRPLTTKDLARLIQQTDPRALPAFSITGSGEPEDLTHFPLQWRKKEIGLRDGLSVDSHRYSRKAAPETSLILHCKINLDHADKDILAALENNLSVWRMKLNEAAGRENSNPKAAGKELRKIFTYRLIPLLDLKIWAISNGVKLTSNEMNARIFSDFSRGESSFLKTVEKNLEDFTEPEGLNRLYSAAVVANMAIS